jgi:triosephosphate isomerase (TIM)
LSPRAIVGVSLKAYFGYQETLDWCAAVTWLPALAQARASGAVEVFVLPSFPALVPAVATLGPAGVRVGAQTVSAYPAGPHTGDVTAAMLAEAGGELALTGHAERRRDHGETDATVAAQVAASLAAGLDPVICVGEPDRMAAADAARWCTNQLTAALAHANASSPARVIVAYEPVWAIGAPEPAPDAHVIEVCAALSRYLQAAPATTEDSAVIYGGAAGPGQLSRLFGPVQGLFLGRFAHDVTGLAQVLEDAIASTRTPTGRSL